MTAKCRAFMTKGGRCARQDGHPGRHAANYDPTPTRSIRIPDDVWQAAQAQAAANGTTVPRVVVESLRSYGRNP